MGLKKKTLIVAVVSCLLASIALLGTTYAIYVVNLKGDKTQQVSSGTLNVEFQNNSSAISLTNAYPMTDEDGLKNEGIQFSVANTGTLPAKYRITLVEDSNNTLTNNSQRKIWRRLLELHQSKRFCRPLPKLLGQVLKWSGRRESNSH